MEKMLLVFGKLDCVKHFLFMLANAVNPGCRSLSSFHLFKIFILILIKLILLIYFFILNFI